MLEQLLKFKSDVRLGRKEVNAFQTEDFLLTGVFYYGIINKKIFH